jgi:hypothetical protein
MELPPDFPHNAPDGFKYEVSQFKSNVLAIHLLHPDVYSYTSDPVRTIWGFVKTKKRGNTHTYHAPINSNKVGKEVDVNETRPWTAMPLNLNPLMSAFS